MFTKEIKGKLYGLIRMPDHSEDTRVTLADEAGFVWIRNSAGVSKRFRLSLDEWEVIAMRREVPDTIAYPIGLMALVSLVIASGLEDHQALLVVRKRDAD